MMIYKIIFKNIFKQKYCSTHKDEIINNFKRETPKYILDLFMNNDEMWDYIKTKKYK